MGIALGDMVHYIPDSQLLDRKITAGCLCAIVTAVLPDLKIECTAFMRSASGLKVFSINDTQESTVLPTAYPALRGPGPVPEVAIPYSASKEPGTWHWKDQC